MSPLLLWSFLNMGNGSIPVIGIPGLEFTLSNNRQHYTMPINRLHYTMKSEDG